MINLIPKELSGEKVEVIDGGKRAKYVIFGHEESPQRGIAYQQFLYSSI